MKNLLDQIGMAPLFHSDFPIEKRLIAETAYGIAELPARWAHDICLFCMPEHLRKKWWNLVAEELLPKSDIQPNFGSFLDAFRRFAHFKGIPILHQHEFDILIRASGGARDLVDDVRVKNMSSLVNLGDEQTYAIIGNEQVLLEPGDGCWIPLGSSTIKLADTSTKTEPDVLLLIKYQESQSEL